MDVERVQVGRLGCSRWAAPLGAGCSGLLACRWLPAAAIAPWLLQPRPPCFRKRTACPQKIVLHLAAQPGGGVLTPMGNKLSPRWVGPGRVPAWLLPLQLWLLLCSCGRPWRRLASPQLPPPCWHPPPPAPRSSFQLLGLQALGFSHGFERLHYLVESAWDGDAISHKFKKVAAVAGGGLGWRTRPVGATAPLGSVGAALHGRARAASTALLRPPPPLATGV